MMWRECSVEERFLAAREAGFVAAEIQVPAEVPAETWVRASAESGLPVLLVNCDLGDFLAGGPGLSGVPGREADFAAALDRARELVELLRPAFLHIGPSRIPEGVSREACLDIYRVNLARAFAAMRGTGVQLVVEAVNRAEAPTVLIGTSAEAAAEAEASGGTLRMLFDIYHSAMAGEDPLAAFRHYAAAIAHIQFSDTPGRQPPGRGTLDMASILSRIEDSGYDGVFGAEYMSFADTTQTLRWMEELA
jgi:hydroxypyruvate isomerase